ncbi:UNVERIFIED_CONTAM: hypothetical protein FKN15_036809 [Acipenser sinensis]
MGASPSPVSKKTSGRKKSVSVEPPAEAPSSLGSPEGGVPKSRLSKKGKSSEKGQDSETGEKEKEKEKSHQQTLSVARQSPQPPVPSHKQPPAPSLGSMLAQVEKQQVADRRVANLLKKAKAQLYKIEKSKSLKTSDQPKTQGQESDSSEASVRGPRIKHVCRRAAVALGRNRAVFPDDMPTLSALPWEEREKILSSMGNDDKSSVAGSEEAETPAPPVKPIKPVTRHKTPQEPPVKKGRRVRKCQNLQWMPSKAYLQKQAKAAKKEKKKTTKVQEKKETPHSAKSHSSETNQKLATPSGGSAREEPARKKSETLPSKPSAEKQQHSPQWDRPPPPSTALPQDPKQPTAPPTAASRKERKQPQLHTPSPAHPNGAPQQQTRTQSPGPSKKEGAIRTPPSEPKKKLQQASEKLLPSRAESSSLNLLSTPSNGGNTRQKLPSDGVHRIRVDFKEDCDVENVWEMGGLSILTSVPITPRVVCLLCASSGHVEFVYCQVCCEPFHLFCLEESERPLEEQWENWCCRRCKFCHVCGRQHQATKFVYCQVCCEPFHLFCLEESERPLEEQWENWCCRRCKFCHVCGRQHQATKQLLECNKCRNSYHPECLGPNYPTRPTKKKKICTKCVHCKSCGATTPGKSWDAQWSHDFSLCHDCAKLFAKGNFCPLCDKCYDDDDYESKMMQCGKCDHWVHSKCENLTDEMYEILSNLPENIAYTCINCTDQHPAEWRTALGKELQGSVRLVLTALLNSRTTTHLLRYRQAVKPPELNPETEESIPSRSSPEGPDPPVLTEVSPQHEAPLDLEGVKRKMEQGGYTSVLEFSDDIVKIIQAAMNTDGGQPENKKANSMVKSFFIRTDQVAVKYAFTTGRHDMCLNNAESIMMLRLLVKLSWTALFGDLFFPNPRTPVFIIWQQMERVFPWFNVKESRFWEPNKVSTKDTDSIVSLIQITRDTDSIVSLIQITRDTDSIVSLIQITRDTDSIVSLIQITRDTDSIVSLIQITRDTDSIVSLIQITRDTDSIVSLIQITRDTDSIVSLIQITRDTDSIVSLIQITRDTDSIVSLIQITRDTDSIVSLIQITRDTDSIVSLIQITRDTDSIVSLIQITRDTDSIVSLIQITRDTDSIVSLIQITRDTDSIVSLIQITRDTDSIVSLIQITRDTDSIVSLIQITRDTDSIVSLIQITRDTDSIVSLIQITRDTDSIVSLIQITRDTDSIVSLIQITRDTDSIVSLIQITRDTDSIVSLIQITRDTDSIVSLIQITRDTDSIVSLIQITRDTDSIVSLIQITRDTDSIVSLIQITRDTDSIVSLIQITRDTDSIVSLIQITRDTDSIVSLIQITRDTDSIVSLIQITRDTDSIVSLIQITRDTDSIVSLIQITRDTDSIVSLIQITRDTDSIVSLIQITRDTDSIVSLIQITRDTDSIVSLIQITRDTDSIVSLIQITRDTDSIVSLIQITRDTDSIVSLIQITRDTDSIVSLIQITRDTDSIVSLIQITRDTDSIVSLIQITRDTDSIVSLIQITRDTDSIVSLIQITRDTDSIVSLIQITRDTDSIVSLIQITRDTDSIVSLIQITRDTDSIVSLIQITRDTDSIVSLIQITRDTDSIVSLIQITRDTDSIVSLIQITRDTDSIVSLIQITRDTDSIVSLIQITRDTDSIVSLIQITRDTDSIVSLIQITRDTDSIVSLIQITRDTDSPSPAPHTHREDSPELIPPPDVGDNRQCVLCLKYGDDSTNDGGRLLYAGQNEWTHVNCALWSAEVFEDDDGSLKNVHMAVIRGKQLRCEHCQRPGATVGCCLTSCTSNYHFMCARLKHCVFLEDKKVYCQRHRDLVKGEVVSDSGFEVTRRIFVDFEGISLRRKFLAGLEPENIHMMIGSMTIDCLGILTDLSDCERKLFPVGYQCSRVYWSTQDARKRCIYTCRIVVCRPPQVESDINSTLEHEDNKTIAHSMAAITDMLSSPVSVEPPAVLSKESLPPPRLQRATRNRHLSYSPTSRSPGSGSRPLPSAGSPSPMTHEIVTVGDTLLSSGLRRIGSRRHSTSSLSPQPPKQRVTSPSRGGRPTGPTPSPTRKESGEPETGTGGSSSVRNRECQPGLLSPGGGVWKNQNNPRQQRLGSGEERVNKEQGELTTKGAAVVSVAAARLSQTSPPLGTAVLSSQGRGTNSSSSKSEKGKTARDPALSPGHGLASRHPSATLPKDGSGERAKNMNTAVPASKEALAAGSRQPPHHKGGKKSWEQLAGGPAEKPLRDTTQPEDTAKRGSQPATSTATGHGTHNAKEKRSKMKAREAAKDKEKLPPNSNTQASASTANSICGNGKTSGSGTNSDAVRIDAVVFENQVADKHLESRDRLPSMEKKVATHSPTNEGSQSKTSTDKAFKGSQPQNETPGKEAQHAQRKRTVKVTLTPLKIDPDVTKTISTSSSFPPATPQKTPACTLPFSSPSVSPQSSESEVLGHQDEGASEIHDHQGGMEDVAFGKEGSGDGVEHSLQDGSGGDKHQEEDSDGSVKRRYPRRSARARSNMFFGLTPFYGVRSYGEEDIPFYSSGDSSSGKKRGGGGGSKRSAEGQVDGADDMTTSSSEETGDEEEGAGRGSDEGDYYYNFTRTVINPGAGMTPSGVIEQCLGRVAPLRSFLKEESDEEEMIGERELGLARIGQLDGVDDGSESDGSVSATTTATASASKSAQSGGKRKGKERRAEKLDLEEETGKEQTGSGGSSSENNKSQKDSSKMENCLPLGSVKAQGQDSLEAQLSLNAELLKSDSDNTNSDDCGNILPSDIMDFVLNTPSMQALGQRPESSSSELMSLEEGFGLGGNRGKEMGLFEDFSQQLTNSEPVESGVSASIPGEEQFELPLELPSDLSVLTTRSPAVASQNHSSLIPEQAERSILVLPSEDSVEKGTDKQHAPNKGPLGGQDEMQVAEGHMTPEQFIQGMETDHMTNPVCGQGVEQGSQDLARTSVTPGLQVPASPTVSLQGPKYIPSTAESPGPTQVASTAVQTTATHLKQPTEKLIVVNQHMQPLYVLQTLPNGVTSVSTAAGVMDTSSSVLGSMAGGLALAAGLNPGIPTSQSIFSPMGKGLPMTHHSQLHAFSGTGQAGFQSGIPSSTSGLLIGVQPSQDPQILVSEAGHRTELAPNSTPPSSSTSSSSTSSPSGHGKKRQISRLQPRKPKKLARSGSQPTLAPSEAVPNMTLINFSPSQLSAGIPNQPTTTSATPHRTVPNIIKRPKPGGMYFEQAPLLQQGICTLGAPAGMIGPDASSHLVPCTVSGLNTNQSVLNVMSVGQSSVSLASPGRLCPADLTGSISNLLLKASQQSLALSDQQMALQSGAGIFSQLGSPMPTSNTGSICVLPSTQPIGMPVFQPADQEGPYQLHHHQITQLLASNPSPLDPVNTKTSTHGALSSVAQDSARTRPAFTSAQSSNVGPAPVRSDQQLAAQVTTTPPSTTAILGKGKTKSKRTQHLLDKGSGKKHKVWPSESATEKQPSADAGSGSTTPASPQGPASQEAMEIDQNSERERGTGPVPSMTEGPAAPTTNSTDCREEKREVKDLQTPEMEGTGGFSSPLLALLEQERRRKESLSDRKSRKGLMFEICSDDGFQICSESIEDAWRSLTDKVQEARSNARLKQLSFEGVNGLRMLGVIHDAVVFLIEQLYGAKHCQNYKFRFHKPEEADEPPLNPHGSARAEVHHRRSVFDMFNFLASKHRQPPEYNPNDEEEEEVQLKSARRATSMDLPMPMRFRHLKKTSKEAVGVYRSAIHGRGLFCKRNIDAGEMVIEYSGNVIRSVLTDKREKYYDGKGIGCYMFRIDDYEVVDATMHGNAARFINHACEPNCYSRVINIDGQKHIVIFATRKIYRGEELTYDYKFPIEDASSKLHCNCGAKKCRKFIN